MARRHKLSKTMPKPEPQGPVFAMVSEDRVSVSPLPSAQPQGVPEVAQPIRAVGAPAVSSYPHPNGGERVVRRHNAWSPTNDGMLHAPDAVAVDPECWTRQMVFAWLTEACDTLRQMPATGCFPMKHKSGMPAPVHDLQDMIVAYGWADIECNYVPTAQEIDRMDRAIQWLYWLEPRERKCVMGVATRMSYRTIGRDVGCHHATARAWAEQGADRIARRLTPSSVHYAGASKKSGGWQKKIIHSAPVCGT